MPDDSRITTALWWRQVDQPLVLVASALFALGLVISFSASPPLAVRNGLGEFHFVLRQSLYAALAIAVMLVLSMAPTRVIRRGGLLFAIAALVALLLLPVLGTDFGKGSIRWYSFGYFSVQPSELLKVGFVVAIAWFLSGALIKRGPPGKTFAFALTAAIAGVLMLQKDYGQAILFLGTWGVVYFLAGANLAVIGLLGVLGPLGVVGLYFLSPHVASRIDPFLSGVTDPYSQTDHVERALQAGGLFGQVGAGGASQALPDAHSDFVLAATVAEFGLVPAGCLLTLFVVLCLRAAWLIRHTEDRFAQLAGASVIVLLALQTAIHFGVNLRVLPVKGMTLPFISYGGSSLLATGLAMGVLLALTRKSLQPRRKAAARRRSA